MKLKFIFPILLAAFIGFLCGKFMFNQYDSKINIKPVFGQKNNKVYFIEQGVYSSKESMEENVKGFTSYIYDTIDGQYYVYIAITQNKENATKLEEYFKNLGYNISIKEFNVDNELFIAKLKEYDALLSGTNDNKAIKTIINQTLEKYEELIN